MQAGLPSAITRYRLKCLIIIRNVVALHRRLQFTCYNPECSHCSCLLWGNTLLCSSTRYLNHLEFVPLKEVTIKIKDHSKMTLENSSSCIEQVVPQWCSLLMQSCKELSFIMLLRIWSYSDIKKCRHLCLKEVKRLLHSSSYILYFMNWLLLPMTK